MPDRKDPLSVGGKCATNDAEHQVSRPFVIMKKKGEASYQETTTDRQQRMKMIHHQAP